MMIFGKISIAITGVILLTGMARIIGLLNSEYTNLIISVCLAVQTAMLIIVCIMYVMARYYRSRCVTIPRYTINDKHVKGDTEIFPKSLSSTNPRKKSIFSIYVEVKEFDEIPEFGVEKTKISGRITQDVNRHILNTNIGIQDGIFKFGADIIMSPNEAINFKFRKDTKIDLFSVNEIYIP